MTMIKCPECRHHISSMAKACPECGAPIDPEWAKAEAERELKKLEEVPFTITNLPEEESSVSPSEGEIPLDASHKEDGEVEEPEREVPTPAEPRLGDAAVPPVPKKGSGGRWLWLWLVMLLLLLIGAVLYYDYHSSRQREQHAYEMLRDCSNPDFYEDFIIRYPKSEYIDEVRERYRVVAQQQEEWQRMVLAGTREDLRRFVREHPTSPYVKVAQGRIDSLDWAEAKQQRSLESVAHYIATHPDGYYIDLAEQLRQTLERQRAEAEALAAQQADSLATDSAQAPTQP